MCIVITSLSYDISSRKWSVLITLPRDI